MIAVMVLAGLMAYLVAGVAIYALWVPSYLKDDTFDWALLNVVFWPLLLPYVEPKEKKSGTDRQAEADHRDSGSAGGTIDPADEAWHQARAAAGAGANPGMTSSRDLDLNMHTCSPLPLVSATYSPGTTLTNPFSLGSIIPKPEVKPRPEVERVKSTMPIMATRWAKVTLTPKGPSFKSVTDYGDAFGVEADATCNKPIYDSVFASVATHDAPDLDCTCGFHAVPSDKLPKHKSYGGLQLLVELSGTVIEHEEGYRASHQRVLQATTPRCPGCGDTATRAWMDPSGVNEPLWDCGRHDIRGGEGVLMSLTIDQLTKGLGVSFVEGAQS